MQLNLDHVVIFVPELKQAIAKFRALGFHVENGGDHGLTENALIPFENEAYIELIAVKSKRSLLSLKVMNVIGIADWQLRVKGNVMGRLMQWFGRPYGPVDWCVRDARVDDCPSKKTEYLKVSATHPREFSRETPDLTILKWTLAAPRAVNLPMYIDDITPRRLRVPAYREGIHENGAAALKRVLLPKESFAALATHMEKQGAVQIELGMTIVTVNPEANRQARFGLQISYSGNDIKYVEPEHSFETPIWFIPDEEI